MVEKLKAVFDFVGVIDAKRYPNYQICQELNNVESIFVVGLSYPKVFLGQKKSKLVGSLYTYGADYHQVIKDLVNRVLKGYEYQVLVDNHALDERKCLEFTGLAYLGKNDLMINKDYGSYFFIGLVLTKKRYEEVIKANTDSCGSCRICIDSCPVGALAEGFNINKCLSALNQSKKPLLKQEIKANYLLLGCDICQRVCPKNENILKNTDSLFKAKSTAYVEIFDLFNLSNQAFLKKYKDHAYLWKGKTILLRNALTILLKQQNTNYNNEIKKTLENKNYPKWYKIDAKYILKQLEKIKSLKEYN